MASGYEISSTDRYAVVPIGKDWDAATLHTVINGWADQGYELAAQIGMYLVFDKGRG